MTYLRGVNMSVQAVPSRHPAGRAMSGEGGSGRETDRDGGEGREGQGERPDAVRKRVGTMDTSKTREMLMEYFRSKDKKARPWGSRSSQVAEGGQGADDPVRVTEDGPWIQTMLNGGLSGGGSRPTESAPSSRKSRRIPDYYDEEGASTLGKQSGGLSMFWDLEYPRTEVRGSVRVFSFTDIQGRHRVGFEDNPWIDLSEVPGHLTRLNVTSNFVREDLVQYITSGFRVDQDYDVSYMHRALDHSAYQISWGNFLMPTLCSRSNAQWMDSYQTIDLEHEPGKLSPSDYQRKKKNWLELVRKPVLATSRTNGGHFNACLYVFPNDQMKQGYVIAMDPYNTGLPELQDKFENIAKNLVVLKRTVFQDPEVQDKRGALDPAEAPPRMRFVMVTHPPHLTQGLDSGCSLWCLFQLTYWINHFKMVCHGNPDAFCDFLDNLFSTAPAYDFTVVNFMQTVVDREASMRSVRRFGLLQLQYIAQAKDAYDTFASSRGAGKQTKESKAAMNDEFDRMMKEEPYRLLKDVQARHSGYVLAGNSGSVIHYQDLCNQYAKLASAEQKKGFLNNLPTLDLIRLCLKGAYENGGLNTLSSDQQVKELMHETLQYHSLGSIPDVKSSIENYRPCKVSNLNYNVTCYTEKLLPIALRAAPHSSTTTTQKQSVVVKIDD